MALLQRFVPAILILRLSVLMVLQPAPGQPIAIPCSDNLTVDGVYLQVCSSFLSNPLFIQPDPGNASQLAYAVDRSDPSRAIAITAVPFGQKAGSEIFPAVDASTDLNSVLDLLRAYRRSQGGSPTTGPTAVFFGKPVESIASQANLPGVASSQPARLTEWVFTAGNRLWIVRAVQTLTPLESIFSWGTEPVTLSITSPNIAQPSWMPGMRSANQIILDYMPFIGGTTKPSPVNNNLPVPFWWSGTCDNGHYQWDPYLNPYHYAAYPLGGTYRNVPACGPRPSYYEGPDVMIYFYDGAFPVYEWECVELSLRFMFLAYGVPSYAANGNRVVWNYAGSRMDKIANGTAGVAPVPGDVLSLCSYCTFGHTSVVTDSSVDFNGNGTVTVMEQNNTPGGKATLTVVNWVVFGNLGNVIGWLHPHPQPPIPTPTVPPTATPVPTRTIIPTPTMTLTPAPTWTPNPSLTNKYYMPVVSDQ